MAKKYIELKHFYEEDIEPNTLVDLKLEAVEASDIDRQDFWTKKISGSKIKDITSRPLSTIAYFLGQLTEEEWSADIEVIPKMPLYREHGKLMEDIIVDRFNWAIENEYKDEKPGEQKELKLFDIIVDASSVRRLRRTFCPSATEKYYIKNDKRTMFRTGNKYSSLFMLNIDGYTTNKDGSIRQLVEVKTKTGALGNDLDFAGYMKLHFDQITYYSILLGATDGALLLVDHHSRGMKAHTFTNREIRNNWKVISPKIKAVAIVVAGTRNGEDLDTIIETIETIDWGNNEVDGITKESIINMVKLLHKGN